MAFNVGVNVLEVDGRANPSIQAAATSVAAFIGPTERGVPDQPVRVTDLVQFQNRFGNFLTSSYLAYALTGFFLNGGREAYIVRATSAGSSPAKLTLSNRAAVPGGALLVSAGFRGQVDSGGWGERLQVDVRNDPRISTSLQVDTPANATNAQLISVTSFSVGDVVRLADGANEFYRIITAINSGTNTISWNPAAPIVPILAAATAQVTSPEFRIIVHFAATAASDAAVVEDWHYLCMDATSQDYALTRVNEPFTGSKYIMLSDISGTTAVGVETPAVVTNQVLTGSSEPSLTSASFIGSAAQRTGLYAFDTVQVQLLAIPDAHSLDPAGRQAVVRAALDYCAGRGDCMYVGSAPNRGLLGGVTIPRADSDYGQLESDYLTAIQNYSALFQAAKVYGALYAPWILVSDPLGNGPAPARFIPPDGHVMGVYARSEQERGIWKAPAGNAAQVRGALAVSANFTDVQHTSLVKTDFVNGIRATRGVGITIAASRTLSTDTRWWFVNVRLLFNFIKASLRDGLRFVRQEPHTEALRRTVKYNVVTPFLLGLWRQGAFGSDPPEMVFSIKCDAENNPPNEVDLGNFKIEVYFYAVRPAETILIVVGQQPSGASTSEA